ncbi:hypothetical protein [Lactococcus lactis]|uniref:hypothetical protein n=1 Tax=Lactococcus lactis TaxID=1358 RepID=UPI002905B06A|nr:hypothetical protein [Lactococcus lactis]
MRWHIPKREYIVFSEKKKTYSNAKKETILAEKYKYLLIIELSCSEIKEIRKLNKKQPYFTITYEEQEKNF